jgi:hypothetical protein
VLCVLAWAAIASAQGITHIDITRVESPTFEGRSFGDTGQYEKVVGKAYGEIDPDDPRNARIVDLQNAPRNAHGNVEYAADFYILQPIDPSKRNGTVLYDAPNRGNKVLLGHLNHGAVNKNDPTAAADAGDGFAMNKGYTLVWGGWQGDLVPAANRMKVDVPVARLAGGQSITGPVRTEHQVMAPTPSIGLDTSIFHAPGLHRTYEPVSLDTTRATLTRRLYASDPRVAVPSDEWAFADCSAVAFPGVASSQHLCLRGGFDPNYIYELVYTGKDPLVLGIGMAATRDVASYMRYSPDSPLDGSARNVIAIGISQSARYLRTFLDQGFNEDLAGRKVFDGMNPHLGSARVPLNVRFGQPGRAYGQREDHDAPGLEWPFSWGSTRDPISGQRGGLLDACRETATCPKIMQTVSSFEYWGGRMSLNTTDPEGRRDLPIPPNVRVYLFSSLQHSDFVGALPICRYPVNPALGFETARALVQDLAEWVRSGRKPPKSAIPTIRERTLVDPAQVRFPTIPGFPYIGGVNSGGALDFGPGFDSRHVSGVTSLEPPLELLPAYRVLVPQVDRDGNDLAGIRSTTLQAPLGTYTGWNPRPAGYGEGDLCPLRGSFVPFARTKAERLANRDPRLSLEERYGNTAGYVATVRTATKRLVSQRLLLPQDAERLVQQAQTVTIP